MLLFIQFDFLIAYSPLPY